MYTTTPYHKTRSLKYGLRHTTRWRLPVLTRYTEEDPKIRV